MGIFHGGGHSGGGEEFSKEGMRAGTAGMEFSSPPPPQKQPRGGGGTGTPPKYTQSRVGEASFVHKKGGVTKKGGGHKGGGAHTVGGVPSIRGGTLKLGGVP